MTITYRNKQRHGAPRRTILALSLLHMCMAGASAADAAAPGASEATALQGDTVLITGQRASMRRALAAQQKADHIASIVSSDDIGALPDKNAAEALARLPGVAVERDQGEGRYVSVRGLGPDYNAVTINGALVPSPESGRRAVALDVLPAGLVRSLEVSKTLTPERDANSLGGTVEVKSLSAFDLPGRALLLQAGASHDRNTGKTSPSASLLAAGRHLDGKLGVAAGISGERRRFGSDNTETGGAWDQGRLSGLELRDYLPQRERSAAALNLDWRPQAGQALYLRAFASRFSDDEARDRLTIGDIDGDEAAPGEVFSARAERRLRQRKYTQQIASASAGGELRSGDWKLAAAGGATNASEITPESINDARFRGMADFAGLVFQGTALPRLTGPATLAQPASYRLQGITLQARDSRDRERHAKFDLTRLLQLGEGQAELKGGVKLSRRSKDNDTEQWGYTKGSSTSANYWGAGSVSMAELKGGVKLSRRSKDNDTEQWGYTKGSSTSANYWGAGSVSMADFTQGALDYPFFAMGPGIDPARVRARVAGLERAGARLLAESSVDDYGMEEDIDAAYVQGAADLGNWRLLAGLRNERTSFKARGNRVSEDNVTALVRSNAYSDWLPNVQARYDLDRQTSVRAAWTNSVVRANFSQLAPGISFDSETEAVIGNPDLKPLKSSNLDLGVERMLGADGAVSAYLYTKSIRNFTYTTDLAGSGAWKDFEVATTYANGERARVRGIELAYSHSLRMLPAPWNGLIVGANASISSARATIGRYDIESGRTLTRQIRLPGQSRHMLNLMLGYESGAVSTRLALNRKSDYLLEVGADVLDPAADAWVDAQRQIDFSFGYQFSKRWQMVFEGINLNNEKYYVYQGSQPYNAQYEQYGRTYKLSLKARVF